MLEMEQNGCEAERMAKAPSHKNEVYAARYYGGPKVTSMCVVDIRGHATRSCVMMKLF